MYIYSKLYIILHICIKEIRCPEPVPIFGGSFNYTSLNYKGVLSSSCNFGFNATNGNILRTCGEFEKWSDIALVCHGYTYIYTFRYN